MDKLEKQKCPICSQNALTLTEEEMDIPYFGKCFLFAMVCSNCQYHKSDVEAIEQKEPCRLTFEINNEKDMKVRVIKSSEGNVKIPFIGEIESGPSSEGYVTNVEGILEKFKKIIEDERDLSEDDDVKKKAKNLLKKIWKITLGDEKAKLIIEDPSGNSAIISDKTKVEKLKK